MTEAADELHILVSEEPSSNVAEEDPVRYLVGATDTESLAAEIELAYPELSIHWHTVPLIHNASDEEIAEIVVAAECGPGDPSLYPDPIPRASFVDANQGIVWCEQQSSPERFALIKVAFTDARSVPGRGSVVWTGMETGRGC